MSEYKSYSKHVESEIIRVMIRRGLTAQSLYAAGALLSFINTYISITALIFVQLFFVFGFKKLKKGN